MFDLLFGNKAVLIPAIIVIAVLIICILGYIKAPPDMAYIVSGLRKKPKILIGRAGVRVPFLERVDKLIVRQISVDIKSDGYIPTLDFIGVDVDAVAKVRVRTDDEGIKLAMRNFLNITDARGFEQAISDSLQGNMREIIGTITLKEICNDRKKFGDEIQSKAQVDMNALGIEIISCNIQRVTDEKGLINALGQDNMSQIQKNASIAKAEAERDIQIAQAEAARQANEAQVASDTQISIRKTELAVKQAELKETSDIKKAAADAAYKIEEQKQRRSLDIASTDADIAKREKEAELAEREITLQERRLDADIRKKADADKYAAEKKAEAELYARKQEAEAIKAKALAEAEGIDRKAEAMKKYGEAAVVEMIMNALPEIAKNVAAPLTNVDSITMYGEGNSTKLIEDIVSSTTQVSNGMLNGLGIDLRSLLAGFVGGKVAVPASASGVEPTATTDGDAE